MCIRDSHHPPRHPPLDVTPPQSMSIRLLTAYENIMEVGQTTTKNANHTTTTTTAAVVVVVATAVGGRLRKDIYIKHFNNCLLYTSDAADEEDSGDLGGRLFLKKKQ
eukprot:TRINITY_DN33321_c0_g1_i2.p1 TRINITY_DN33321_c0_g1~~TRINITY_DN33321_c0_g1_i2.p1  ORF type:complete len:107 (+),score=29.65 TRINITY_DN33321_c0_g1_i2:151-471(+)